MFPNIKVLDGKICIFILLVSCITLTPRLLLHFIIGFSFAGERVVGRGSDLYQLCKDIDDTIKGILVS